MSRFMQPQITEQQWWFYYKTKTCGITWVPTDLFSRQELEEQLGDDLVGSIGVTAGYGVRLSAPGYLDCTPWDVYGDKEDAEAALSEYVAEYEDDEDDEDDGESHLRGMEAFAAGGMDAYNEARGYGVVTRWDDDDY